MQGKQRQTTQAAAETPPPLWLEAAAHCEAETQEDVIW